MNPIPAGPKFKCQVCYVSFPSQDQLELHIDGYSRILTFLMERVAKASAHLIPLKLEVDDYPIPDVTSKCPLPRCTLVMPLEKLKWHFSEHVTCYESCPGCLNTFVNAQVYLNHVKACICITFDEAKVEHSMRTQRALNHRTAMKFKEAMDEFKPEPIEGGQGGNGESLPQNQPSQNLPQQNQPPQSINPQNLHTQDPYPQDINPQDLLLPNFLPQRLPSRDNGPGLVYSATRDAATLDQQVGLTDPETTNQSRQKQAWVPPKSLHPNAFGPTPRHTPGHTHRHTPRHTPGHTHRHTPRQTPRQTPGQMPEQTPRQTPGQTPGQTTGQTPGPMPRPAPINTMPPPPLPPPSPADVTQFGSDVMMPLFTECDLIMDTDSDPSEIFQFYPN
ncbi:hypothetical protein GGI43DRAFT_80466 [Trichoderma evansii]